MVQKSLFTHLLLSSLSILPLTDQLMQGSDLNGVQVDSPFSFTTHLLITQNSIASFPGPFLGMNQMLLRNIHCSWEFRPNVHNVDFKDHGLQYPFCVCMQILEEERPWLGRTRREVESQAKRMLLQGLELMVS